ncbi:hypothetical protein BYT27DRAFT_7342083 [Phlegmacium glaucopus]|nr:hypothetical protein BYT27DRAFT_7342083 [Phlegmacium glaucopus]
MDPLPIALPGLSIPTTIETIIEVAQAIEDSLDKVAQNMEKSRRLASDILKSVRQIETFYNRHHELLEGSEDLEDALDDLNEEMKAVHIKCKDLFLPPTKHQADKARMVFNAWRNRGKVEADIVDLRNHVQECHIRFTTFAVIRIDRTTTKILDSTAGIEGSSLRLEQLFALDQSQVTGLKQLTRTVSKMEVPKTLGLCSNSSISNTLIQNVPPTVEASVISDMHPRIHIDPVDQSPTELQASQDSDPGEVPLDDDTRPFKTIISVNSHSKDRATRHREVVRKSLDILDILQNKSSLSIQEGTWEMVSLAIRLHDLEMFVEAATIGAWTVELFRRLVRMDATTYQPYLALSLLTLAGYHLGTDNLDQASLIIAECVELNQQLQLTLPIHELRSQLARSLTTSSTIAAKNKDYAKSLQDAEDARVIFDQIFEEISSWEIIISNILENQDLSSTPTLVESEDDTITVSSEAVYGEGLGRRFDMAFNDIADMEKMIYEYGKALHRLSYCLDDFGRMDEAAAVDKLALEKFRYVCSLYSDPIFDADLAETLYHLSHTEFRKYLADDDEVFSFSGQAVDLYRELCKQNPKAYGLSLYNALWEHAGILHDRSDEEGALEKWHELINVATTIITDRFYIADALHQTCWTLRRLSRHDEAATVRMESVKTYRSVLKILSTYEADGNFDLAVDLQLAKRCTEAIPIARKAISQYRSLAIGDPTMFTRKIAQGLNSLAGILNASGQPEEALIEGHDSMKLYQQIIVDDGSVIKAYIRCLRVNVAIAFQSTNEAKALERSAEVVEEFRKLIVNFPEDVEWGLADAFENHGHLLVKHKRLREAVEWNEGVQEWYRELPVKNGEAAQRYMICLINTGSDLDNQGYTEKALIPIAKAVEVGKEFHAGDDIVSSYAAGAMLRYAHLLCELGRYPEALKASEESVEFGRKNPVSDITEFAGCLLVLTMALSRNGRSEEALKAVQEAVDICRNAPIATISQKNMFSVLQLPHCLQSLSETYADVGNEEEALVQAHEAVKAVMALKSKECPLPWTLAEGAYGAAMENLAVRLIANGDLDRSLELLLELKVLYEERTKTRHGAYTALANILCALGICYCAMGRHEEGVITRGELEELQTRLDIEFPGLARLVEIELTKEAKRPSRAALWRKLDLPCQHQHIVHRRRKSRRTLSMPQILRKIFPQLRITLPQT